MHPFQVSEAEVSSALKNRFKNEDVKLLSWKLISLDEGEKLGNLGDHFRVESTVRRNGKDEDVSFFAKTTPMSKVEQVYATSVNRKEALFYNQLASELISILSNVRPMVPDSKALVIPRCYLATDSLLIMEDLDKYDFKVKNTDGPLPLVFFLKSMRALARFHASSMVLEERLGRPLLTKYSELVVETFLNESPYDPLATFHAASLHAANALVPLLEKYKNNHKVVEKTQKALPGLIEELMASAVRAWPGTRNVFCHGDVYINNVLFRMDTANNPIEAVLVDYQMLRYAPPASDIVLFLMTGADKAFRDMHFEEVLREYHNELRLTLQDLGYDVDKLLPWDELQRTFKAWKKYGLLFVMMDYPFLLAPSSLMNPIKADNEKYYEHVYINRTPFAVKLFQEYEPFRSRYSEVCEELIENYILEV